MAIVNAKLNKFDDADRNFNEAEKILKKIPQSDPDWKKREGDLKKIREEVTKIKKGGAEPTNALSEERKKRI